jgi:CheY-like chemotaxis protein
MTQKDILLIDDEPNVLLALKLLLEAIGHKVQEFNNPEEAVAFLGDNPQAKLDLILCDLRMPGLNGLQVLSASQDLRKDIPFILISGHAVDREIQKAYSLGASGFLGKPFTPDQLKDLLAELGGSAKAAENS